MEVRGRGIRLKRDMPLSEKPLSENNCKVEKKDVI
jgi:hypothetical protein